MTRAHRLHFFDHPFFEDLLQLCQADALADDGDDSPIRAIEAEYHQAREQRLLPQFHPPLLDGERIMQLTDLEPGTAVGELKQRLREAQINGEVTTAAEAEEWIRQNTEPGG